MPLHFYSTKAPHGPGSPIIAPIRPAFDLTEANPLYPWHQRSVFNLLWEHIDNYLKLVPRSEADIIFLPCDWFWVRGYNWRSPINHALEAKLLSFYEQVEALNKPIITLFTGDRSHEHIPLANSLVFRHSVYQSKMQANDRVLPVFIEDFVDCYTQGHLYTRKKGSKPVIGFCGLAVPSHWQQWLKRGVYHSYMMYKYRLYDVDPYFGENLRYGLIGKLDNSDLVESNFIIRSTNTFIGRPDNREKITLRAEYVTNTVESDYILCCRGSGNFSFRLYEALSLGRIPVVVDTDMEFPKPLQDRLKTHCVWVPGDQVDKTDEYIAEFHDNIGDTDFLRIQNENRELWQQQLSPHGYMANLEHYL